jgi:2,4-dienoyl-CoA reductase-like NADH-dependent reductase (Old Yellow Enzyme family)
MDNIIVFPQYKLNLLQRSIHMKKELTALFEPLSLKSGVQLNNRVVMAPMTHFLSNEDGTISHDELRYYAHRANGPGMIITACANVTPNGKAFPGQPGVDRDETISGMKELVSTIKSHGAKAVLQIHHGGRACPPELVPNQDVVAPSASTTEGGIEARELTGDEVEGLIKAFGDATRRAIEAGFDGVEIHGANGYLLQQFFSAHTNKRNDRFGGSIENRLTFPLAIVDEVKKVVAEHAKSSFLVGYRLSPEEPETEGITMADTFVLLDALTEKGLDYIHISLMEFWSKPRRGTEDTRSRIEIILDRIDGRVPVIGVGSIYSAEDAAKAMTSGVPLLALARELIIEPNWVQKVQEGKEEEIQTVLHKDDQERLVIPNGLWNAIVNTPGWFPFAD